MHERFTITFTESDSDIYRILSLQQQNLTKNISVSEALEQGFVTVEHSYELLNQMCEAEPAVIAKDGDEVVGYALVMIKELGNSIPILIPMFKMFDEISYKNKTLSLYNYFVMGQICIDKDYRGMGIFDLLYQKLKKELTGKYELLITEVAKRNVQSIKAHKRVGLQSIHEYEEGGEEWCIMVWEI